MFNLDLASMTDSIVYACPRINCEFDLSFVGVVYSIRSCGFIVIDTMGTIVRGKM